MTRTNIIITLLVAFFVPLTIVHAQVDQTSEEARQIMPIPPQYGGNTLPFDSHRYSVTMRGNGEAVVQANITLSNTTDKDIQHIDFGIQKITPIELIAFQILHQPRCITYGEPYQDAPNPKGKEKATIVPISQHCLEYDNPADMTNWYGSRQYQKATVSYADNAIGIDLPKPIPANGRGNIVLSYRAFGYAKKQLYGSFVYSVTTLQSAGPLQQVTVGIDADSDFYLKGARGNVDYTFTEMTSTMQSPEMGMSAPVTNSRMDMYYQQIGSGAIIKSAQNLGASETFTVKGSYADSRLKLYVKEIAITLIIFIGISIAVVFLFKSVMSAFQTNKKQNLFLIVGGTSFISSFFIVGNTILLWFISTFLQNSIPYELRLPLMVLVTILFIGTYALLFLLPSLYVGYRRGIWLGVGTFASTTGWIICAVLIFILYLFTVPLTNRPYLLRGIPLMGNSAVDSMEFKGSLPNDTLLLK